MANTLAYLLDGKIYINLTNRCTNDCIFCLRAEKDDVCGQEMWLDSEDFDSKAIISQLKPLLDNNNSSEVVFCGYGEPMLKLEILKEVAKFVKENYKNINLRINTNGHANYVYKRNVIPELVGLIDEISVSLNAENSNEYDRLSQPKFEGAYEEVKKFVKASTDAGIKTVVTAVDKFQNKNLDKTQFEKIANDLNATLRIRDYIENGYS